MYLLSYHALKCCSNTCNTQRKETISGLISNDNIRQSESNAISVVASCEVQQQQQQQQSIEQNANEEND